MTSNLKFFIGFVYQFGSSFESLHERLTSSKSKEGPVKGTDVTVLEVSQASETMVDDKSDVQSALFPPKAKHVSGMPLFQQISVFWGKIIVAFMFQLCSVASL